MLLSLYYEKDKFKLIQLESGIAEIEGKEIPLKKEIKRSSQNLNIYCWEKSEIILKSAKIKVDKQKGFKIVKKNVYGKNISIYLKTLIGRIYTININESENVRKLKEELTKIDGKYRIYNTILIYKNKIMDDDEYLSDYELDNESLIDIISK